MVPGRRNNSQRARALPAAVFSRRAVVPSRTKKLQPATSATAAVSSPEPPSAISTSLIMPAVAPDTSAAKVGTKARSESLVAMMTLSMGSAVRRGSAAAPA